MPDQHSLPEDGKETKEAKIERTRTEVAAIVAEYQARCVRAAGALIGAIYARYSSRHQDSVADQVRSLLLEAERRGIYIPADKVFFDTAVRGYKNNREGLNSLRACIQAKSVQVVIFFATNRLFRKSYRSMQFVEEEVVERGLRAIFAKSGIDTADGNRWKLLLQTNAMIDEFVVGVSVENIRAAHEGLLEKRLVFGTISFGYRGVPIPGETTRRGRPRRRLAVDPIAAEYVKMIYQWYVIDRVGLTEIIRRLRADPAVPKPPKAPRWSRAAVVRVLKNARYRGYWEYGVTETVWLSSKDYARQVPRREPLKGIRIDEFRLVEDGVWYQAQVLLKDEAAKTSGRKPRDGDSSRRPKVLNGLFVCPTHNRKLYVGGPGGRSMFCPDCQAMPAADRPLFSLLPRDVALRKTCDAIANAIRDDAALAGRVIAACIRYASEQQTPDPARQRQLERRLKSLDGQIQFIFANPGESSADQEESQRELRRLRQERANANAELQVVLAAASKVLEVPTHEDAAALLARFELLLAGASLASDEASGPVRELFDLVTGGRIELEQQGDRAAKRGWLRGRFVCRIHDAVVRKLTGVGMKGVDAAEIAIDYRRDEELLPAATEFEVIRLYESRCLVKEIARRLDLNRNTVAGVLDRWFAARGEVRVDGRSRRGTLETKHLEQPLYQRIADRVKALADEGRLFDGIAHELGVDRNTLTSAWKYWHSSRGISVPDGRTRRKLLAVKSKSRLTALNFEMPSES